MTRIEGAGAARDPQQFQTPPKKAAQSDPQAQPGKHSADSIKLSDAAIKIAKKTGRSIRSREALIEAARARLAAGALESPEAFRKAAENLLSSGDLTSAADEE